MGDELEREPPRKKVFKKKQQWQDPEERLPRKLRKRRLAELELEDAEDTWEEQ